MGSSGLGEGGGTLVPFGQDLSLSCLVHQQVEIGTGSGCRYKFGNQLTVRTQSRKESFFLMERLGKPFQREGT